MDRDDVTSINDSLGSSAIGRCKDCRCCRNIGDNSWLRFYLSCKFLMAGHWGTSAWLCVLCTSAVEVAIIKTSSVAKDRGGQQPREKRAGEYPFDCRALKYSVPNEISTGENLGRWLLLHDGGIGAEGWNKERIWAKKTTGRAKWKKSEEPSPAAAAQSKKKKRRGSNSRGTVVLSRLAARTHTYATFLLLLGGSVRIRNELVGRTTGGQRDSKTHTEQRENKGKNRTDG